MNGRLEQKVDRYISKTSKQEIGFDTLVDNLVDEFGISRDAAERKVQENIRNGILFEPEPGKVRKLRS